MILITIPIPIPIKMSAMKKEYVPESEMRVKKRDGSFQEVKFDKILKFAKL